jgi:mono/diheme cytochrome c family protein
MKNAKGTGFVVTTLVWAGWMAISGISAADMDIQKQAKAAGVAVDNCAYCHGEKMPKKGASTMNDRGKWLMDEKAKRKADKVDGAWLKDYPGDKK